MGGEVGGAGSAVTIASGTTDGVTSSFFAADVSSTPMVVEVASKVAVERVGVPGVPPPICSLAGEIGKNVDMGADPV